MSMQLHHNAYIDVAMNLFYYVFSVLYIIVCFYYGKRGIKTRTSECLICLGWRTLSLFLCWGYFTHPSDSDIMLRQ